MTAAGASGLARVAGVRAVSLNAGVKKTGHVGGIDTSLTDRPTRTSVQAPQAWNYGRDRQGRRRRGHRHRHRRRRCPTSARRSRTARSRVVATAVTNPVRHDRRTTATATARTSRASSPATAATAPTATRSSGNYVGVAPDANLISIKVADDDGQRDRPRRDLRPAVRRRPQGRPTTSASSTCRWSRRSAQSYKTDPLDAAVEAAWFNGIVVVAAAGNRGTADDAVDYAPGNDPYVITVGGVDDQGTKGTIDDAVASWSSRGTTQDGFAKPDILAPGAHIVSNLAPNSAFASLCPSCIVDGAVHPRRRHLDGGADGRRRGRATAPGAPGLDARTRSRRAVIATGRTVLAALARRGLGQRTACGNVADDERRTRASTPNTLINPTTGDIDYTGPAGAAPAGAGRCLEPVELEPLELELRLLQDQRAAAIDPTRSSWSRSSWSTSWTK